MFESHTPVTAVAPPVYKHASTLQLVQSLAGCSRDMHSAKLLEYMYSLYLCPYVAQAAFRYTCLLFSSHTSLEHTCYERWNLLSTDAACLQTIPYHLKIIASVCITLAS